MTGTKALKVFMESGLSGRKLDMSEMKALSPEERKELGALAAAALGEELEVK